MALGAGKNALFLLANKSKTSCKDIVKNTGNQAMSKQTTVEKKSKPGNKIRIKNQINKHNSKACYFRRKLYSEQFFASVVRLEYIYIGVCVCER